MRYLLIILACLIFVPLCLGEEGDLASYLEMKGVILLCPDSMAECYQVPLKDYTIARRDSLRKLKKAVEELKRLMNESPN